MRKKTTKNHARGIGVLFGIGTFVVLSFLAGGLIEFSRDVGFARWFSDMAAYTIMNKFVPKLVASFVVGGFAIFAANMIAYGKAIKEHKVQRVQFQKHHETDNSTRIA